MKKTITFFNIKGGVGKTTLTVNTAAMLAAMYPTPTKVLILDLDAQAGATNYIFGSEKQEEYEGEGRTVYDMLSDYLSSKISSPQDLDKYVVRAEEWNKQLYLVPGSYGILDVEKKALAKTGVWLVKLRSLISLLAERSFKYVFIDPPATFGVLAQMSLAASNYFIVPVIPDELGFGVLTLFKSKEFNSLIYDLASIGDKPPLCGGVVFNRLKSDTHSRIADELAQAISRYRLYGKYKIPVYKTRIKDTVQYTKCLALHRPIFNCKEAAKPTKETFKKYFAEFYRHVIES